MSSKQEFEQELQALGLTGKDQTAGCYDLKGKYAMSEDFNADNFKKFVQDYLDGKLEVHVKSEPVPTSNDQPVKVRYTCYCQLLLLLCHIV